MGVGCDGRCDLAIGIEWCDGHGNPNEVEIRRNERTLAELRADPGTGEGGEIKPFHNIEFPNKWCVRQCERCQKVHTSLACVKPNADHLVAIVISEESAGIEPIFTIPKKEGQ